MVVPASLDGVFIKANDPMITKREAANATADAEYIAKEVLVPLLLLVIGLRW